MCVGDSITYGLIDGADSRRIWDEPTGGYRPYLYDMLRADQLPAQFVGSVNVGVGNSDWWPCEGHPGAKTDDFVRCAAIWDRNIHADYYLIMLGINDFGQGDNTMLNLAHYWQYIYLHDPNATILVSTLTPAKLGGAQNGVDPEWIYETNNEIRNQVQAWRKQRFRLNLVDMNREVQWSQDDFGSSGLHPTDSGYRKMAVEWMKHLAPLLLAAERSEENRK